MGSFVHTDGHTCYTLTDEHSRQYTSRLRIKDTVDPLHRAYSRINNMTERQACNALFEMLERLWEYRAEHMRVNEISSARNRIAFHYRVHAVIALNRILTCYDCNPEDLVFKWMVTCKLTPICWTSCIGFTAPTYCTTSDWLSGVRSLTFKKPRTQ